jgi:hypothetical protein
MSNFTAIESAQLNNVTGGGIDDPSAPSLSDLRSSSTGFGTTSSSHTAPAPVIKPFGPAFRIGGSK